jgi:hypothetical protein
MPGEKGDLGVPILHRKHAFIPEHVAAPHPRYLARREIEADAVPLQLPGLEDPADLPKVPQRLFGAP